MSVKESRDNIKYRGALGPWRKLMDSSVEAKRCGKIQEMRLGDAMKGDAAGGLVWNVTGTSWNEGASIGATLVIGITSLLGGIDYLVSDDFIAQDNNPDVSFVEATSLAHFGQDGGTTIISRGDDLPPYLLQKQGDNLFLFSTDEADRGIANFSDDSEDLVKEDGWEWELMPPVEAMRVLMDFEAASSIYSRATNPDSVLILSQISPISEYSAAHISPAYTEGGDIHVSAEGYSVSDQVFTTEYTSALHAQFNDMVDGLLNGEYAYGFDQNVAVAYEAGDFNQDTLSGFVDNWFAGILPLFMLSGFGVGLGRAGFRATKAAASKDRKPYVRGNPKP